MAVTKIWAVHTNLGRLVRYVVDKEKTANLMFDDLTNVLEYAADEYKTEQKYYVSGINCTPETAEAAMKQSLMLNDKPLKILGFHGYQSFAEGEVDEKTAHEIGMRLAQELWGEKFQVVVATHCNTNHFHNHFVVCGTSFMDGSRYPASKATYRQMREVSDQLCREYGLSVIENAQRGKSRHYAEWNAEKQGNPTWRGLIKDDIDLAISQSVTDKQFFYLLRQQGYDIKIGKDISVRPRGKERFVRLARNFGEDYTQAGIYRRILENEYPRVTATTPELRSVKYKLKGNYSNSKRTGDLRGLYLHYCYRLGVFSKKKSQSTARMEFILREDILKLHTITEEMKLLARCHIDTSKQLFSYRSNLQEQIKSLSIDRKSLRNKLRSVGVDGRQKDDIRAEITRMTKELERLRHELKLCDGIAERSGVMAEKLKIIRKENYDHEYGNRGSGPVREDNARRR